MEDVPLEIAELVAGVPGLLVQHRVGQVVGRPEVVAKQPMNIVVDIARHCLTPLRVPAPAVLSLVLILGHSGPVVR